MTDERQNLVRSSTFSISVSILVDEFHEAGHAKSRKEAAQLRRAFQEKFPHSSRVKTAFCK
jgi:hypothetical protein